MHATPRLTDARIMVVDDERVNVVLLERILEQDGYRNVKSVTDPSEAVASATRSSRTWSCSTCTCPSWTASR
jgi:CheY-like chemotaxis protein